MNGERVNPCQSNSTWVSQIGNHPFCFHHHNPPHLPHPLPKVWGLNWRICCNTKLFAAQPAMRYAEIHYLNCKWIQVYLFLSILLAFVKQIVRPYLVLGIPPKINPSLASKKSCLPPSSLLKKIPTVYTTAIQDCNNSQLNNCFPGTAEPARHKIVLENS